MNSIEIANRIPADSFGPLAENINKERQIFRIFVGKGKHDVSRGFPFVGLIPEARRFPRALVIPRSFTT